MPLLACLLAPLAARAQDEAPPEVEAPVEAPLEPIADDETSDWDVPRVLVVARRDTPDAVLAAITTLASGLGELVGSDGYVREARARGLPPDASEAMQAILGAPEVSDDDAIDLVIVVGVDRPQRPQLVRIAYHDRYGLEMLDEAHSLSGGVPTEDAARRILAEARLALAVITRPPGGLAQTAEPGGGATIAPGVAIHVGVSAGIGFGTRELEVPTTSGLLSLAPAVFPAASLSLVVDVEPTARGRLTLGAGVEYLTSFGLVVTDVRTDGTTRDTGARSQGISADLHLGYRFEDSLDSISLRVQLGWYARSFAAEAPVSLPDYTLQGPALAAGIALPILGVVELVVLPELQWIADVGRSLRQLGLSETGVAVGGTARVRVRIVPSLSAELAYRESHAILSTTAGAGAGDVERWVTARLEYRP